MSNPSLFDNNQNNGGATPPQENNPLPSDDLNTLLSGIKNERGEQKYKDVKTALEALKHSQEYIPEVKSKLTTMEQQLAEARAEAEKVKELEAVVNQLAQGNGSGGKTNTPEVSQEEIARIVKDTLAKSKQEDVRAQNVSTVVTRMQKAFGQDAENKFYGLAQEAGLSRDEINDLASKSPAAVFKILGITGTKEDPLPSPTNNSVNTAGLTPRSDSYLNRNPKSIMVGATTEDIMGERDASKKLVEEMHSQGKSVYDLTDPKVFFKVFGKK